MEKITPLEEFYTATGSDGIDKFHLCHNVRDNDICTISDNEVIMAFIESNMRLVRCESCFSFRMQDSWILKNVGKK